jgi:hypothetical protein
MFSPIIVKIVSWIICILANIVCESANDTTKCPVEASNDLIFKEGNNIDRDGKY